MLKINHAQKRECEFACCGVGLPRFRQACLPALSHDCEKYGHIISVACHGSWPAENNSSDRRMQRWHILLRPPPWLQNLFVHTAAALCSKTAAALPKWDDEALFYRERIAIPHFQTQTLEVEDVHSLAQAA